MIKLTVTRKKKNPYFKEEEEAYKKSLDPYGSHRHMDPPKPQVVDTSMEVEITEEQFNAIRKEVLKNF